MPRAKHFRIQSIVPLFSSLVPLWIKAHGVILAATDLTDAPPPEEGADLDHPTTEDIWSEVDHETY